MNHNWLLIIETHSLSLSSRYYKVIAGTGKQAQSDLAFLKEFAYRKNCFLHKWDNDAVSFLEKVIQSLSCDILELNIHHITARSLVSIIKETGDAPRKPLLTPFMQKLRSMVVPNPQIMRKINVIRQAEAEQRNKPKVRSVSTNGFL